MINTHRNDFLVIKLRCLTYSSSAGGCAGRRRPVRARRGFATEQRLNISTRSSELLDNPPCLQGLTRHCHCILLPNEWTTRQASWTCWAGYSFFLLSFGFMAGCKRDLLCKPPPTVREYVGYYEILCNLTALISVFRIGFSHVFSDCYPCPISPAIASLFLYWASLWLYQKWYPLGDLRGDAPPSAKESAEAEGLFSWMLV